MCINKETTARKPDLLPFKRLPKKRVYHNDTLKMAEDVDRLLEMLGTVDVVTRTIPAEGRH